MYAMEMYMFNVSSESLSQYSNLPFPIILYTKRSSLIFLPQGQLSKCVYSLIPFSRLPGCSVTAHFMLLPLVSYSPSLFQPRSATDELAPQDERAGGGVRDIMDN